MLKSRTMLALEILSALGKTAPDTRTTVMDIAVQTNRSESFIEQIMSVLRTHELVIGYKGPHGGYSLVFGCGATLWELHHMMYPNSERPKFIDDDLNDLTIWEVIK